MVYTRKLTLLIYALALFVGHPSTASEFDLMAVERIAPKGRVQDAPVDPEVSQILSMGKDAIPLLIESVGSSKKYQHRPVNFWPEYAEGDMALAILTDLFLDSTWERTTLPEFCWGTMLGWTRADTDAGLAAWDVSSRYIGEHGRESLATKWREAYARHSQQIVWDEDERFFRVEGLPLEECVVNPVED